jgi:cyanophycinase
MMAERNRKAAGKPPGKQGVLIIIGGREDDEGDKIILKEVVRHVKNGRLVLATVASQEPDHYFERYQKAFAELGINGLVELYVDERAEASLEDKVKLLDKADAIFFSGGDQLRITSQIGDTPIFNRIHEIFEAGGLVAGTSAGASAMSDMMLVRGNDSASFRIGDLHMAPGLGLIKNTIIDQHFAERGRIGRLIGAVAQNPRVLGIGIDEDTAVVVEGDHLRVIGCGAVYLVDGSDVSHSNIAEGSSDQALSIHNLRVHVLSSGDGFDLESRTPDPLSERQKELLREQQKEGAK